MKEKLKIIVTDGHTLNPGDLSWEHFYELGDVQIYPRLSSTLAEEILPDAQVIITNKTPITGKIIHLSKDLRMITVTATGHNIVDVKAARRNGTIVCNVPGYGTDSVAQHVFAMLLELANHVGKNAASVHRGDWNTCIDWCYSVSPIIELRGKTLGIIGYGRIGQKVADIARVFGMDIIYSNGRPTDALSIKDVFSMSDVISLHCPLTASNTGLVNNSLINVMKPTAYLINTSRGGLINETEFANALKEKRIAAAALDVLSKEPPDAGNPLIGLENCLITPHNAWLSFEARQRIMNTTYENIERALNGDPQNLVS